MYYFVFTKTANLRNTYKYIRVYNIIYITYIFAGALHSEQREDKDGGRKVECHVFRLFLAKINYHIMAGVFNTRGRRARRCAARRSARVLYNIIFGRGRAHVRVIRRVSCTLRASTRRRVGRRDSRSANTDNAVVIDVRTRNNTNTHCFQANRDHHADRRVRRRQRRDRRGGYGTTSVRVTLLAWRTKSFIDGRKLN